MINCKSLKWGYGVVALASLGLTGCFMNEQPSGPQPVYAHKASYHGKEEVRQHHANGKEAVANEKSKATGHKTSSSRSNEPAQPSQPGPKRAAAPSIPVIE